MRGARGEGREKYRVGRKEGIWLRRERIKDMSSNEDRLYRLDLPVSPPHCIFAAVHQSRQLLCRRISILADGTEREVGKARWNFSGSSSSFPILACPPSNASSTIPNHITNAVDTSYSWPQFEEEHGRCFKHSDRHTGTRQWQHLCPLLCRLIINCSSGQVASSQ